MFVIIHYRICLTWIFITVFALDKSDKYDPRDVERLQQDDNWIESYLYWRHNVIDETLKMLDESFQWRKEMTVNGKLFNLTLTVYHLCINVTVLHLSSSIFANIFGNLHKHQNIMLYRDPVTL